MGARLAAVLLLLGAERSCAAEVHQDQSGDPTGYFAGAWQIALLPRPPGDAEGWLNVTRAAAYDGVLLGSLRSSNISSEMPLKMETRGDFHGGETTVVIRVAEREEESARLASGDDEDEEEGADWGGAGRADWLRASVRWRTGEHGLREGDGRFSGVHGEGRAHWLLHSEGSWTLSLLPEGAEGTTLMGTRNIPRHNSWEPFVIPICIAVLLSVTLSGMSAAAAGGGSAAGGSRSRQGGGQAAAGGKAPLGGGGKAGGRRR
eukprot:TRINITY_DN42588_c0_g1_i1.p1 TRINITY_DN42588_c0_g1~~TRINITY_DN42588_c0_g1_i1.p1  ORF type:complete len:261 (+),score=50.35 TRINITY_DN42588_c0_g1_i1:93-875(+)